MQIVRFNNQDIITVEKDGVVYVGMKSIVENLGLDWSSQSAKLRKQAVKFNYGDITMVAQDGKERLLGCIPLTKLNGWLFSINPSKVRADLRDTVELYQEECFDVLYKHFHQPKPQFTLPDFTNPVEAARAWAEEFEAKQIAQAQLLEAQPKIAFYDTVTESDDTFDFADTAKVIGIPKLGRNKLMLKLRAMDVLRANNTPYQEYVDRGYFEVAEVNTVNGVKLKTMVTQKGLDFILKQLS